ncbi:hypothetical protein scyTo_0016290 [Scyliorhinus torazame]|uniref:Uncharacterized protein n=1 Tax=Scyliorhinus torazame TaxID=75743 RepID=A0A401Q5J4_SCYTO|nr:hypothetical protein [Scyliorhinus torazame]
MLLLSNPRYCWHPCEPNHDCDTEQKKLWSVNEKYDVKIIQRDFEEEGMCNKGNQWAMVNAREEEEVMNAEDDCRNEMGQLVYQGIKE